MNGLLNILVY
ncbi:unnamed protein product, partial [Rotaria sp. Silwood2]